ncbi:sodium/sulfate transporter, putative [Entamoeba invadens IP1]|uniref:sodium/sulfate transporter, putative n=1 Tax=Entamoeba invadens IP1 TaxID=370355 RepID=UPI0002C3F981|nr:sodium/sulfate transporter, putative [Entamoeba invadens IP1]ELP94206.1 sodium/sulfate transporter, putative [Entamoeba invadens IP1]|eukprot:XP_004260977.1 sodium/sulfate transporter, putative [Entamoeba invadens IP1]
MQTPKRASFLSSFVTRIQRIIQGNWKVMIFFVIFTTCLSLLYFVDWKVHYKDSVTTKTYLFMFTFDVMLTLLLAEIVHPGLMLLFTSILLVFLGIITAQEAFMGFANNSTLTVLVALIISEAVDKTGGLKFAGRFLLPDTPQKYIWPSALRLFPFVMLVSLFLNNTPVVAMSIPLIFAWTKTSTQPASKLLLPMCYAIQFGGMNSILGTSTNLVAKGLILNQVEIVNQKFNLNMQVTIPMFEIGLVALPLTIVGLLYTSFFTFLVPNTDIPEQTAGQSEFLIPVKIAEGSSHINKKLKDTVLFYPSHGKLFKIKRGELMEPKPDEILKEGDVLYYLAPYQLLNDVYVYSGIVPESRFAKEMMSSNRDLKVYEVCFGGASQFIHKKFPNFVNTQFFSILGISYKKIDENDQNEEEKVLIGDDMGSLCKEELAESVIESTRSYLICSTESFENSENYPNPFQLVLPLDVSLPQPMVIYKTILALLAIAIPVITDVIDASPFVVAAFVMVFILLVTKTISIKDVFKAVDVPLICILGASFGLVEGMVKTNVGALLARSLTRAFLPFGKIGILSALAIPALLLTQSLSNAAVFALMFPVVWETYWGADPTGMDRGQVIGLKSSMYAVMIATSSVFLLPFGSNKTLMVMKKGNYRVKDFIIFGIPLVFFSLVAAVGLSYVFFEVIWPDNY